MQSNHGFIHFHLSGFGLTRRYSGQKYAGQHDHRAVCRPHEPIGGQGTECGQRLGPVERFNVPAGSVEEARDYGSPG